MQTWEGSSHITLGQNLSCPCHLAWSHQHWAIQIRFLVTLYYIDLRESNPSSLFLALCSFFFLWILCAPCSLHIIWISLSASLWTGLLPFPLLYTGAPQVFKNGQVCHLVIQASESKVGGHNANHITSVCVVGYRNWYVLLKHNGPWAKYLAFGPWPHGSVLPALHFIYIKCIHGDLSICTISKLMAYRSTSPKK